MAQNISDEESTTPTSTPSVDPSKIEVPRIDLGNPATNHIVTQNDGAPAANIPVGPNGETFPYTIPLTIPIVIGNDGKAYGNFHDKGNPYVLQVGSKEMNNRLRALALNEGVRLHRSTLSDANEYLYAYAALSGEKCEVWIRVAHIDGGIEIDVGDGAHTRIRITAGKVEVIK